MEVYEPREDSYLLQKYVERFALAGSIVLDMGTGSGIQAITAARNAKKVIAADINPEAIRQASMSASIEKAQVEFIESDLFENIPNMKFDLIAFNPPYLPEEKNIDDPALFSAKRGTETTIRFINQAADYLNDEGIILLAGSSLASTGRITEALENNLFAYEIMERQHVFFEDIFIWHIAKSDLLKKLHQMNVANAKVFAKGKRGVIVKAIFREKNVAVKTKRPESTAPGTIENEARMLKTLNKHGIGPNLLYSDEEMIIYEFVEGVFIEEFIKGHNKERIILMLKKVFEQLYTMDRLGINKFEMHRPVKHIIIGKEPVLIDFERARYTQDPKNVTQFCDFLSGDDVQRKLKAKNIIISREELIRLAKAYKTSASNFEKLMEFFG
jgi:release factor glutamine methyltransferase